MLFILTILLGDYEVCVKFNEDHIEGSPFPVTIVDGSPAKSNASKVRAHGRGLTSPKLGPENEFSVDANDAGKFLAISLMVHNFKPLIVHHSVKNYTNDGKCHIRNR